MAASRRFSPVFLISRPAPNKVRRSAQAIDVDADPRADPAGAAAAVPQEYRDRLIGLTGHDPGWNLHRAAKIAQLEHIFVFDPEPLRRRGLTRAALSHDSFVSGLGNS